VPRPPGGANRFSLARGAGASFIEARITKVPGFFKPVAKAEVYPRTEPRASIGKKHSVMGNAGHLIR